MKYIGYLLFILIQCTWGLGQTLLGLVFFCIHRASPHTFYKGCVHTEWKMDGGISLGLFIFTPEGGGNSEWNSRLTVHEYGHAWQSLLLGPFYIIPGLASLCWSRMNYFQRMRREKNIPYSDFWTERWANWWGEKLTGRPSI